MLIVGGGENYAGRMFHAHQVHRRFKTVHAGHADVHQQHVRIELRRLFDGFRAAHGFADDGVTADVG